jgi:rod shape-determining protein MreC
MESFFTRYRNLVVLLAILVAQIIGLAMQVRRSSAGRSTLDPDDSGGVRLIRLWANAIISPPERLIHATKLGIVGGWSDYIDLIHIRQQNQDLQKTVGRLRLEQAALLEDARQGQRLQALLGFQEHYIYATLAAQAYGSSGSDRSHVFYIDKGAHDGLKPDMAVVTGDGIVGKVRDVFPNTAQVLAVNDTTSGAGVILETTRIRGILKGNIAGELEVVGIVADQRIHPGENVLTAGGDLIFPRGLPVGVVDKVVRDPDRDGLVDVIVKPAAHLDRLDEVLIITSTQPRFSPQEQQDINASEVMKGSEAAAVNDQMKASAIMAEKLPGLIDPNLPADQQPLNDSSNPNPAPRPPQPLHPDEFSPSDASSAPSGGGSAPGDGSETAKPKPKQPVQPAAKSAPATPQRDQ